MPQIAFDTRRLLLYAPSPTAAAILGYVTHHHLGAITYIQQDSAAGEMKGFVEAWPRTNRPEWDLAFLAPSLDGGGAGKVWQRLLSRLIVVAGEKNISRIYARPQEAQVEQILRQVGFTLVRREEILVLTSQTAPAPPVEGLRSIEAGDGGALRALCHRVQSHLGKGTEDVSPHRILDFYPYLHNGTTKDEYVWRQKGTLVAYLGLEGSPRGYWLDIVVDPDSRADLLPCLEYILGLTECAEKMPLYCPVADNVSWLGGLLQDLGFTSYTRQAVLVAHTKARTSVRCEIPVTALEKGIDMGAPVGQMFEPSVRKK
ncbi:MAG: hypothetical protein R6V13_04335 [Anaerolineae bacterium]